MEYLAIPASLTSKHTTTQHPNGGRVQRQAATIINFPHGSLRGHRIRRGMQFFHVVLFVSPAFFLRLFCCWTIV